MAINLWGRGLANKIRIAVTYSNFWDRHIISLNQRAPLHSMAEFWTAQFEVNQKPKTFVGQGAGHPSTHVRTCDLRGLCYNPLRVTLLRATLLRFKTLQD